jgi:ankyrin repeat protein
VEKDVSILKEFEYKRVINKNNIRTYNIYMYVCMYGTPEMLKYLETYLSNIKTFKDERNTDSYLIASSCGNLEVMKYLEKEHNWDIHVKNNYYGYNAYLIAIAYGNLEIIKYLEKEHNFSPITDRYYGYDAYSLASYNGQLEIMKYLEKEHNWNIYMHKLYKYELYYDAKRYGQIKIIKYLENKMFYEKLSNIVNNFLEKS